VIPDDLSALDEEIADVRRELRHERRMARLQSIPLLRRFPARGLPGTFLVLSLFAIALLGTLLMAFPPGRNAPRATARPLANPTERVGTRGGLVPMVDLLDATGRETPARTLRPSVLAYVPAGCACADQLLAVAAQAHEFGLSTYFIEGKNIPSGGVSPATLSQQSNLDGYTDTTGKFASFVPSPGNVTLWPVSPNGRLALAPFTYHLGDRLEQPLANLVK
jgi:hypothetical protein